MIASHKTIQPASSATFFRAGPPRSSYAPALARSEMVIIPTVICMNGPVCLVLEPRCDGKRCACPTKSRFNRRQVVGRALHLPFGKNVTHLRQPKCRPITVVSFFPPAGYHKSTSACRQPCTCHRRSARLLTRRLTLPFQRRSARLFGPYILLQPLLTKS